MTGLGIHIFAGGFTVGVQKVMPVHTHLETHGFGLDTARKMCNVEIHNSAALDWPYVPADFVYGNPRCTAFSTITSGYANDTHGPFAKQTCDVQEFAAYTAKHDYPIVIWESVQQAYTTGRPLIRYLIEKFYEPKGYRIAHLFVNARSFGNAQNRKRYFFVAYKSDRNFNVAKPKLGPYAATLADVIYDMRDRETKPFARSDEYDEDSYIKLTDNEQAAVPFLARGQCLNNLARHNHEVLPKVMQDKWKFRTSELPFSLHCVSRLDWNWTSPTLHSSASRFIHPDLDRPLTVGELSRIMGWPTIPVGPCPSAQIAKGVCPEVGEWLAQQAMHYLNDEWGSEDFDADYCDKEGYWYGKDTHGQLEKTFNLTRYTPGETDPRWQTV